MWGLLKSSLQGGPPRPQQREAGGTDGFLWAKEGIRHQLAKKCILLVHVQSNAASPKNPEKCPWEIYLQHCLSVAMLKYPHNVSQVRTYLPDFLSFHDF